MNWTLLGEGDREQQNCLITEGFKSALRYLNCTNSVFQATRTCQKPWIKLGEALCTPASGLCTNGPIKRYDFLLRWFFPLSYQLSVYLQKRQFTASQWWKFWVCHHFKKHPPPPSAAKLHCNSWDVQPLAEQWRCVWLVGVHKVHLKLGHITSEHNCPLSRTRRLEWSRHGNLTLEHQFPNLMIS